MSRAAELRALADRVEKEPASRGLDEAIAFGVGWRPKNAESKGSFEEHEAKHDYPTSWIAHAPYRSAWAIPAYTSSVDAALALVPVGRPWSVAGPIIHRPPAREREPYFHASVDRPYPYQPSPAPLADGGYAATAPLALCAACLRALASEAERSEE